MDWAALGVDLTIAVWALAIGVYVVARAVKRRRRR